jgi:esterase/lipase superfamily enzyme
MDQNDEISVAEYKFAQLVGDSGGEAVPVLFAWPPGGTITGCVADKEAAIYSRDQLAHAPLGNPVRSLPTFSAQGCHFLVS